MPPTAFRVCRTCALQRYGQSRTFFSFAKVFRSSSPPPAKDSPNVPVRHTPFTRLQNEDEQELYDDLTDRFLEKLRMTDNAEEAWEDYSKLVENTLEKFNLSILSHHRLFKMLQLTPAPRNDSKAHVMSSIVKKLAWSAKSEEYERLIRIHDKQNDVSKILSLINEMRRNGIRPTIRVYNHLIRVYIRNNNLRAAMNIFEKLRNPSETDESGEPHLKPDVYTYSSLIRGHLENSNHSAADRLFTEMRALGIVPNLALFNALMLSYLRRGRNGAALRLFDELRKTESLAPNIVTYRLRVAAYVNSGNTSAARRVLDEMLSGKDPLVPLPDYAIWKMVIKAYAGTENLAMALELLHLMQERSRRLSNEEDTTVVAPNSSIFSTAIALCCRQGEIADAQRLYDDMLREGMQPTLAIWNTMIAALSRHGDSVSARRLYSAARESHATLNVDTLAELVRACLAKGQYSAAIEIGVDVTKLDAAVTDEAISPITEKVVCPVVEALSCDGRHLDQATNLVHAVIRQAHHYRAPLPSLSRLYCALMNGYANGPKEWERVIFLFREYLGRGGQREGPISDLLIKLASKLLAHPAKIILELVASNELCPTVSGWIQTVDALLDSERQRELRALLNGLEGRDETAARLGYVVLDMVLDRIDARHDQAVASAVDGDESKKEHMYASPGLGKEEIEQVLALIARRLAPTSS
ncbi:hypothetical protein SpCBS45565_g06405 [Spizellomyces sp. 'palustris']|nr:hypothetical protein SpCBS45565_g06405 [Spizellomyces sp. 'palustris']